jgi:hypothetical protein
MKVVGVFVRFSCAAQQHAKKLSSFKTIFLEFKI